MNHIPYTEYMYKNTQRSVHDVHCSDNLCILVQLWRMRFHWRSLQYSYLKQGLKCWSTLLRIQWKWKSYRYSLSWVNWVLLTFLLQWCFTIFAYGKVYNFLLWYFKFTEHFDTYTHSEWQTSLVGGIVSLYRLV